jgi:hypothetical protein
MTISSTTSRWVYNGDGGTTVFTYDNKIYADTDLKVYVDGVLQTIATHYTVSGVGEETGGSVTFVSAPASGTSNVLIVRDVPDTQGTDFPTAGPFPSQSVEDALDKLTILEQQLGAEQARKLGLAASDPDASIGALPDASSRASKALHFDSAGAPVAITPTDASGTSVTASVGTISRLLAEWVDPLEGSFTPRLVLAADVIGQVIDQKVGLYLNTSPPTDEDFFSIHVKVDASGETDGKRKIGAYFSVLSDGAGNIFGINPLIEMESGYSGACFSIEADVNNRSGVVGVGIGLLINGASTSKIEAGIVLRMNAGAAGGEQGIRIEDDWDNQLVLGGANTDTLISNRDSGNDARFEIIPRPKTNSDNAQIRLFRSTDAADAEIIIFKGDNSATQQITMNATKGIVAGKLIRSGRASIADDAVTSFTPPEATGTILVTVANNPDAVHAVFDDAPSMTQISLAGTKFELTTGVLAGTTGTDAKATVSIANTGVVYIENRLGATGTFQWSILS